MSTCLKGISHSQRIINFSLRQLQEKCREQQQPLFCAFMDLTKAFDLVRRSGLLKILKILQRMGCPPKSTVCFDRATFLVSSGVKQGCVLALTQTLQHHQILRQDQSLRGAHTGAAVCCPTARRASNIS